MKNMPCKVITTIKTEQRFQYNAIGNDFSWNKTSDIDH